MITTENLSIGYKAKGGTRCVANGISVSLRKNGLTCLIGSNGAGKSTLLRTLVGFQPKLDGKIYIKGKEISEYTHKELARMVSVVLTQRTEAPGMTVAETVALGRTPYTGFWGTLSADDKTIVERSIGMVGLAHLSARKTETLSDGERQKMMLAKALAQQTPLIILDEPTAFLDYPSKVETMLLLMRLSREADKTILMSTHDLELALQTADTVWLMDAKGHMNVGSPRQLADTGALTSFIERQGITFDKRSMRITLRS